MENIRALESQLLRDQVTKLCLDQSALLAAKILIELRDDLLVGEVYEGEKIVNHAYGVADTQAVFRSQCDDGLVLGNPIGSAKHFAIFKEEITVVHQSKCGKTEASAGRCLERPARKQFVELIVDVRMTDDFAAGIGQEQSFNDPEFFAGVLLKSIRQRPIRMVPEDFEKILVAALAYRLTQLGHLLHGLW